MPRYKITVTLPGSEPVVSEVAASDGGCEGRAIWNEALVRRRVQALQKRYPGADVSYREVEEEQAGE